MVDLVPISFKKGLAFYVFEEWTDIFTQDYGWHDFHFIKLSVMDDKLMGAVEADIFFMGFGAHFRYVYKLTEQAEEVQRRAEDAKREYEKNAP